MDIFATLLSNLNYVTIFILMLLESTVIPVPSELVVAPAAYHAASGNLHVYLVILFATLGADVGATINYLATITGRLIPGIRHLISIPAGLAKMTYWRFLLYTTIGAGCWNCILAALGWYLHSFVPEDQLNDTIMKYGEYIKVIIMSIVAVALLYFIVKWLINRHRKIKFGNKD